MGRFAMRTISAEPYASELTTAFVRNANPIQIREQIWRCIRFGPYGPSAKQKGHSFECPFCFAGEPLYLSVELYRQEGQIFKWDR